MSRVIRLRALAMIAVAAFALGGCNLADVQAPVAFKADHRLHFVQPDDEAEVKLPAKLTWRVTGFDVGTGNRFAVFVDRPPISPGKELRLRACSEKELTAIQPGEDRSPCHDDRTRVFTTAELSLDVACILPRDHTPKRVRNHHTVTVILLDASGRRAGLAASSRTFEVKNDDALQRCRGITSKL